MDKKNLRKIKCTVTAQTLYNLEHMAAAMGTNNIGRVIDKLTRDRMISIKESNIKNKNNIDFSQHN